MEHLSDERKRCGMGHGGQQYLRQVLGKDGELILTNHVSTACSQHPPLGQIHHPMAQVHQHNLKDIGVSPALAFGPRQGPASHTSPERRCFPLGSAEQPKRLHLPASHPPQHRSGPQTHNPTPTLQHGPPTPQHTVPQGLHSLPPPGPWAAHSGDDPHGGHATFSPPKTRCCSNT